MNERDVDYGENYPEEGGSGVGTDDQPVVTADEMQEKQDLLQRCVGIAVSNHAEGSNFYSHSGLVPVTVDRFTGKLAGGAWEYGHDSGTWLYRVTRRDDLTGQSSVISLQFSLNDDKLSRSYDGKCGPGAALLVGIAKDGAAETAQQVHSDYVALLP